MLPLQKQEITNRPPFWGVFYFLYSGGDWANENNNICIYILEECHKNYLLLIKEIKLLNEGELLA